MDERIVPNTAPIAYDITTSIHVGQSLSVNSSFYDADNDLVVITGISAGDDPKISFNNNSVNFASDTFIGTKVLTYTIDDNQGGTASATITINFTNAAPTASNYDVYVHAGNPVTVTPTFYDADGDSVSIISMVSSNGTLSLDNGTITFTSNTAGDLTYTYTVADSFGATSTGTVYVHALNQSPTPNNYTLSAHAGSTIVVAPDMFVDPDGDPLSIINVGTTFHGTISYDPSGSIIYTPNNPEVYTESFVYYMGDTFGGSGSGNITVIYTNNVPNAQNFSYSGYRGSGITGNLLDGASDADGDNLTAAFIQVGPNHGSFTVDSSGAFIYTPAAHWVGTEVLCFAVYDGVGGVITKTVTFNVLNHVPIVTTLSSLSTDENTSLTFGISASDADSDPLTIVVVTPPAHGTLTVDGMSATYLPDTGYYGYDGFEIKVTDGWDETDLINGDIQIDHVNHAPVASPDSVTTFQNQSVEIYATTNDTDLDDERLGVASFTSPSHGTVSLVDGVLVYTPFEDWTGTDTLDYTIVDQAESTATTTVTVNVVQDSNAQTGIVWLDHNGNGQRDEGESGISGVVVELYNLTNDSMQSQVTDSVGAYQLGTLVPESSYRIRVVNPDSTLYRFTAQNVGNDQYDSDVDADGYSPTWEGDEPDACQAGMKEKPKIVIADNNGITNTDLSISKWQRSFELNNQTTTVLKKGNADFIDGSGRPFFVKIYDIDTWTAKTPFITATVSTKSSLYSDNATTIPLSRWVGEKEFEGWYVSDTQMLVSDQVDNESPDTVATGKQGINDVNVDLTQMGADKTYTKNKIVWPLSDRIHRVGIDGQVKAKYDTANIDAEVKVPIAKKIQLNIYILRNKLDASGGTAVVTNESVDQDILRTKELLAQAGIEVNLIAKTIIDPPNNDTLKDGLAYSATYSQAYIDVLKLKSERAAPTGTNKEQIDVYFVNFFKPENQGKALKRATLPQQAYANAIIIAKVHGYTTMAHEIWHLIQRNSDHFKINTNDKELERLNLMVKGERAKEDNTVYDSKRLISDQIDEMQFDPSKILFAAT